METLTIIIAVVVAVIFIAPLIIGLICYSSGALDEDLSKPHDHLD